MADVLKLAMDRRAELHAEVGRIEDFIRMADSLLRKAQPHAEAAETVVEIDAAHGDELAHRDAPAAAAMAPGVTRMNLMRRGMAAPAG